MQRKLEGKSLEVGAKIDAEHQALEAFQEALNEEFQRRWNEYRVPAQERMDALIEELGALENLDMENYRIDGVYYAEHGLMFIVDEEEEDPTGGNLSQAIARAMRDRG